MNRLVLMALAGTAAIAATPAHAQRVQVSPYIELGQVLTADLNDGDVLTYSSIAAGVDASIQTRRVTVTASYQYERRIAWDDDLADSDVHSGLVRASAAIAPGFSVEGGALATRVRADIRGGAPGNLAGNVRNVSQLYSLYAGPTLQKQVGQASLNALYRFGYTKVEVPSIVGLPVGQDRLDYYDDATSHLAMASIGARAGAYAPFGITLSGALQRENAGQLDQRYDGQYLRADFVQPLTPELALVAGVGYENIEISQRDALVDADGSIVLDRNGRFVTDPASPRRTAFETDGVYWDAGILWRPSPRTTLEARIGRRYDSWSYTGSFSHQTGARSGVQVGVYDSVQSYGRALADGLSQIPLTFDNSASDPFSDNYNGCIFGTIGSDAGGCFNGILQSASTSNYRARGINGVYVMGNGPVRMGIGAGYANRRFFAPPGAPGIIVTGITDESFYGQFFASADIDRVSGVNGTLFFNYLESGLPGAPEVWGGGATGSYFRRIGRIRAQASAGLYASDIEGGESDLSLQALLGLGYRF